MGTIRLTPAVAVAESGNVRDVMLAVPGVECQGLIEVHGAQLGMAEHARPIARRDRAEQRDPSLVQIFKQRERCFHGSCRRVAKLGPARFFIGLDGGHIFGEREFESHVGVHVAVGNVMRELANGPTAGTIGRVELRGREAGYGGGEARGRFGDRVNESAALRVRDCFRPLEVPDRVTRDLVPCFTPVVAGKKCDGSRGRAQDLIWRGLAGRVRLGGFEERRKLAQAFDCFDDAIRYVIHFFFSIEAPQAKPNRAVREIL